MPAGFPRGAPFHGTTVSGLDAATLEVTNNATATQGASVSVNVLRIRHQYGQRGLQPFRRRWPPKRYVGDTAAGTLTQSGGANAVSDTLSVGNGPGSSGGYGLSGSGKLSSTSQYVGYSGTGNFAQTGGTNTVSNAFYLGYNPGSSGIYTLCGSGQFSASYQAIGYSGTGNFTQSGGTQLELQRAAHWKRSWRQQNLQASAAASCRQGTNSLGNPVRESSSNPAAPTFAVISISAPVPAAAASTALMTANCGRQVRSTWGNPVRERLRRPAACITRGTFTLAAIPAATARTT